jgi:hypothetical protein
VLVIVVGQAKNEADKVQRVVAQEFQSRKKLISLGIDPVTLGKTMECVTVEPFGHLSKVGGQYKICSRRGIVLSACNEWEHKTRGGRR